jgi:putative transposase
MKAMKISPKKKKRFKHTTDSGHGKAISPNLLDQCFQASELGKIWVSDITYIALQSGFVYLTSIIDLADRMVVGWSLSSNMTNLHTTIAAFKKAVKNRPIKEGLIFHSDRGSQYASDDFRALLKQYKCNQSMSRKGNCWDNAVAESFFKTIKVEELYHHKFKSIEQVYSVVFDYIDGWYNTLRIHSTLGGISPRQMAQILAA